MNNVDYNVNRSFDTATQSITIEKNKPKIEASTYYTQVYILLFVKMISFLK